MRVSEIYLSVQGEGPRVGSPTVFLRFGGCNLRCPGWPCDTQHAIDPKYRAEWLVKTPLQVAQEVFEVGYKGVNVCFTGGEPFLQPASEMDELINILLHEGSGNIECFSNGTLEYTKLALDNVAFIMDWKLPGSGEFFDNVWRNKNFLGLGYKDAIKFTISNSEDYLIAKDIWNGSHVINDKPSWYYGIAWGKKVTDSDIIRWALEDKLPWLHTMQVHNYIWNREQRGI